MNASMKDFLSIDLKKRKIQHPIQRQWMGQREKQIFFFETRDSDLKLSAKI